MHNAQSEVACVSLLKPLKIWKKLDVKNGSPKLVMEPMWKINQTLIQLANDILLLIIIIIFRDLNNYEQSNVVYNTDACARFKNHHCLMTTIKSRKKISG